MSNGLAWIFLVTSGILDVGWAIAMKKSEGFRNIPWSVASLLILLLIVVLLTRALAELPLGVAYSVWVGIGAIGSLAAGYVLFGESVPPFALACSVMIIIGIIGLKLTT